MSKKTYVIAEMAWGHMGNFDTAIRILKGAKDAGANAIGIHITDMENYMVHDYKCIVGQTLSDSADQSVSIYNYLDNINLSNEKWVKFDKESKRLGVDIVAMCNDMASYNFSKSLDIHEYVISAASFLELELIKAIAEDNDSIILRIGGATLQEIHDVVNFILSINSNIRINLLAGVQLYPTPISQLQLASVVALQKTFPMKSISIGLADHVDGDDPAAIYLPALALPLGVNIIEKHITTDRSEKLEDYEAALGIAQFAQFVNYIRLCEEGLGFGNLDYLTNDTYEKYRNVARKKIVAAREIKPGEIITRENLAFKRSDDGESLDCLDQIIGKRTNRAYLKDQGVVLGDLAG